MSDAEVPLDGLVVPETPEHKWRSPTCENVRGTTTFRRRRLFGIGDFDGKRQKIEVSGNWDVVPPKVIKEPKDEHSGSRDIVSTKADEKINVCYTIKGEPSSSTHEEELLKPQLQPDYAKTREEEILDLVWEFYFNFMLPDFLREKYKTVDELRYGTFFNLFPDSAYSPPIGVMQLCNFFDCPGSKGCSRYM